MAICIEGALLWLSFIYSQWYFGGWVALEAVISNSKRNGLKFHADSPLLKTDL